MIKSIILSLFALSASAKIVDSVGDCSLTHNSSDNAVDKIDARGSVSFEFAPLFPSDPKLAIAIEGLGDEQTTSTVRFVSWLEYSETVLTDSDRMITQMELMYVPGTPTPGDGNAGCDGVWGKQCSELFREKMRERMASMPSHSWDDAFDNGLLEEAVRGLNSSTSDDRCSQLSELKSLQLIENSQLAIETPGESKVLPSGDSENAWLAGDCSTTTFDEILDWTFVGLVARVPDPATTNSNQTSPEDVQFQFACMKAVAGDSGAGTTAKYDLPLGLLVFGVTTVLGFSFF